MKANSKGSGSRGQSKSRRGGDGSYLAILGDLVGSRNVRDRAALQGELRALLRAMKGRQPLRGARAAGPEITSGDEFQVLLHVRRESAPAAAALAYMRELTEDLPVRIAFGVGLGALTTPLEEPIRELDGASFHHARRALDIAKREGRWVVVSGIPQQLELAVNSILRLTGDLRDGWTDRQREIIRAHRTVPLQKKVAHLLGVSPSVISAALKSARYDAILEAERTAIMLLNWGAGFEDFEEAESSA